MLKKFMLERVVEEQLSDTTGTITFHLVDENGDCRRVEGITFLGENKKAQGVSTKSIRELPLIESLFSNRDKKIVEVEFDHFNKVYDRETDQTINQVAYNTVKEMQDENKFSHRLTKFFKR
jgi:hypothetical protein